MARVTRRSRAVKMGNRDNTAWKAGGNVLEPIDAQRLANTLKNHTRSVPAEIEMLTEVRIAGLGH